MTDDNGQPVTASIWFIETDERKTTNTDGLAFASLLPGTYPVVVQAPGHTTIRKVIEAEAGKRIEIGITLAKARVHLDGDRIVSEDKIFFDNGASTITSTGLEILDEIAILLLDQPELTRVEIQGHTDDRGQTDANDLLSQARAEAVQRHLVDAGVPAERLQSRGYGERFPLEAGTSEQARAKNQRTEFHILQRTEP